MAACSASCPEIRSTGSIRARPVAAGRRRAGPSSRGGGPRSSPRVRRGCATDASGPRPARRPARRCGRPRRRRRPGPGTPPAPRDARAARRRASRPRGRAADPPAGGCPCRSARCRTRGRGAARSRPPRAPPPTPTGGSGSRRIIRSSVDCGRPASPSRAPSRAPARPANANPTAASIRPSPRLRRAYREVNPGICSAKVRFGQSGASQNNRRTPSSITTGIAADRRIGHPAPVAAVDPRRRRPAPGTAACRPDGGSR